MIRVESIEINDFKKIRNIKLQLSAVTALVGGNTSGKSSVLQGAQMLVSLLQASFLRFNRKGNPEFLSTLANESVPYRPTENLLELCRGQMATQEKGFSIRFVCIREDESGSSEEEMLLEVVRGKNANLALKRKGPIKLAAEIASGVTPFSIFTPGLSGIPHREEWRTAGAIRSAVMHGDANLYLRTVLEHLLNRELNQDDQTRWWNSNGDLSTIPANSGWYSFSTLLDRCYPGARVFVRHNSATDRYVEVSVVYEGAWINLDMASTGMLQVIQILAYACLYHPPLLLLDEPDAHLHADSQARLYEALSGLAQSTNTRILLASHSPQLIQRLMYDPRASIIWMSDGEELPLDANERPAIPLLMELGALSIAAEAFDPSKTILVLTEDKNTKPVLAFTRANGANSSVAYLSYNGCGNLSGARQLARLLLDIRPELRVIIHRDRDFRTEEEVAFDLQNFRAWRDSESLERLDELFTPLNDAEHMFAKPAHLYEVFETKISIDRLNVIINDVIAEHRDEFTGLVRDARSVIRTSLYASDRLRKKDSWAASGMPDKCPPDTDFLPASGKEPLTIEQCHGKTLLRRLIPRLHQEIGGNSKGIAEKIFAASNSLADEDWSAALSAANHMAHAT